MIGAVVLIGPRTLNSNRLLLHLNFNRWLSRTLDNSWCLPKVSTRHCLHQGTSNFLWVQGTVEAARCGDWINVWKHQVIQICRYQRPWKLLCKPELFVEQKCLVLRTGILAFAFAATVILNDGSLDGFLNSLTRRIKVGPIKSSANWSRRSYTPWCLTSTGRPIRHFPECIMPLTQAELNHLPSSSSCSDAMDEGNADVITRESEIESWMWIWT